MPTQTRILIVEDEPLIIRALSRMLQGHCVHVVSSVAELVRNTDQFDIAFCDISLSDGSSLDRLAHTNARRVVLMSGAPPAGDVQRLLDDRADVRWLAKPFLRDDLMAFIAAA
jgi:CheY-like chemotaxis protein